MIRYFQYFSRLAVLLLVASCVLTSNALDQSFYAQSSKLSSGKWVKISVSESGIYQITADDIRSWGLGSDLSQIHVFGYGGAPLSEIMRDDNYADDLPQMPIVRTNDAILFYGQGIVTWKYLSPSIPQLQVQHPYSKQSIYFVTNDSRFSDIEITQGETNPTGSVMTTYTGRMFHEQDIINPGEAGRAFLGENFLNNKSQTFKFTLDGLVEGSTVKVLTIFGAQTSKTTSTISYAYNGKSLPTTDNDMIGGAPSLAHDHYLTTSTAGTKQFVLEGTKDLNYTVTYSNNGTAYLARLDYITVNYERELEMGGSSLVFGLDNASKGKRYHIAGASASTRVWDVTLPFAPVQMNTSVAEGSVEFTPDVMGRREFVAFNETGSFLRPKLFAEVTNQDIHSEPTPDMIILAPSAYLEQARRVAALHEKVDKFRVLVLDHEKVFNEFSSGMRDAMAYRRLCKMFFDRGMSEDGHKLGYLLLMGAGSYDNRLIGTNSTVLDYPSLLTWQSERGDREDYSITTDDYYGLLNDGSGIGNQEKLSIAVGRMPVKSVADARTAVNKLEKYVTKPAYGAWKNQALVVADDGNGGIHMEHSDSLICSARRNGGQDIVFNRIYIDAFESVSNGGSRYYPGAREKMFSKLNEGVLWWNYIGHASTQNWTGEGLMMRSDVETQLFYKHLPVLYAATCEYSRFDGATLSSGERIFMNANGGAIAVLCPARLAYITENGYLSYAVGKYMFSQDESGKPRRIGDIMRLSKNEVCTSTTDNYRRFFVLGDPAMRLAYAPYSAKIEKINGQPVDDENMPVFKARGQVEFSGKIVNHKGELVSNFDGAIISTLFGPEQSVTTHGYSSKDEGSAPFTYDDRPNRLAINVDTVIGGEFTVRIIIPSEVDNEYDDYSPSLINLYAYDRRDTIDAKGTNSSFYIYGYEEEQATDTIGPKIIVMGLNSEEFVDGSDVNESPLLLATVSDESGVNFSSAGIGHNMSLTLDGSTSYNDLVSYYTPSFAEEGTLGDIRYQLNDLSPGLHTLRLRVWDVYNNVGEKTISFNVVRGLAPEIGEVYATSNPASIETSFYVKHNRPDAVVNVTIEVYDLMGRMVWSSSQSARSDMYTSIPVTWDLVDLNGRRVPRGIYVYRATISTDGIQEATVGKKLAVTGD
ncbi:MAG: type IX secretion system sortase PorU [Muribaculaceae bacterium]|nr:type IX secretion system sortase PorU [Muribaculaceae bacterium]